MNLFDISNPGVAVTRSSFGGGWAWALNEEGRHALRSFFEDEPTRIPVIEGDGGAVLGYIVEPQQSGDLAENLRCAGIAWEVR